MPGFGNTLSEFARFRKQFGGMGQSTDDVGSQGDLIETVRFGTNPGNLRMRSFVPDYLPPSAPLVVVLHGCTQTSGSYDHGAGWSDLAARHGFAVLLPEQLRANNPNLCFNWFLPEDTRRGQGEAASIKQMIDRMILDHGLDPKRVFVTGLSAGGAMTAALLACYPETFAAGAIIAGLPYGCAGNMQEALAAMFQGSDRTGRSLGDRVRRASSHTGPWPRVSIWQGTADKTVKPNNADEIAKQWIDVHGVPAEPLIEESVCGFPHRIWTLNGEAVVETYSITGMAHGTPIDSSVEGAERCGVAGPYILDVGIASTPIIAQSWGLLIDQPAMSAAPRARPQAARDTRTPPPSSPFSPRGFDVNAVIDKALSAAGLIRGRW